MCAYTEISNTYLVVIRIWAMNAIGWMYPSKFPSKLCVFFRFFSRFFLGFGFLKFILRFFRIVCAPLGLNSVAIYNLYFTRTVEGSVSAPLMWYLCWGDASTIFLAKKLAAVDEQVSSNRAFLNKVSTIPHSSRYKPKLVFGTETDIWVGGSCWSTLSFLTSLRRLAMPPKCGSFV